MVISDNPAPSWYKEARAASHVTSTLAGLTSWRSELTTPIDRVIKSFSSPGLCPFKT